MSGGGGCVYLEECLPRGCLPGGVSVRGCLPKGCLPGRGISPGSVHLPLWTEFLTHASENITFPQLLRAVTKAICNV